MPVRIISWNIFNFAGGGSGVMSKADALSRMLAVIHPPAAGPACDIFVIIEPVTQKQVIGDLAVGGGPDGGVALLGHLRARPEGKWWRMATPICIYSAAPSKNGKGETVLVFYNSRVVAARGPDTITAPGGAWESVAARKGNMHWIDRAAVPATLITSGIHEGRPAGANFGLQPDAAAFDLTNNRVYWIDRALNQVCGCDLTGLNPLPLTPASAGTPRLPVIAGTDVYWADTNLQTIWRADLTHDTAGIVVAAAGVATALCIAGNKLVWANATDLMYADLDGANAATLAGNPGTVESICAIGNVVYWTDTASGEIRSCDVTMPGIGTVVSAADAAQPRNLTTNGTSLYWTGTNGISAFNVGNSTGGVVVAAVAAGTPAHLAADAAKLFWVDTGSSTIRHAALNGNHAGVLIQAADSGTPVALCAGNNRVHWIDEAAGRIRSAAADGTDLQTTVAAADARVPSRLRLAGNRIFWVTDAEAVFTANDDGSTPVAISNVAAALAVEPASDIMFWVDRAGRTIRSATLGGLNPAVAVDAATAAGPLALAATNAHLYWVQATGQINVAAHDGTGAAAAVLAANAGTPGSLAASTVTNKIYWSDTTSHEIRHADLNGANHAQFVAAAAAGQPAMLHTGNTHLTWIDAATGDVQWTPLAAASPTALVQQSVAGRPLAFATATLADHHAPDILSNVVNTTPGYPIWKILNVRESCPMRTRFLDIASGNEFDLVAHHAPSPSYGGAKKNRKAQEGVKAFRTHAVAAGTRVVYLGDLNLCHTAAGPCVKNNDGHAADITTLDAFPLNTPPAMTLVQFGQPSSLKSGKAAPGAYREHAYDHIIAKGHIGLAANVGVIDLIPGVVNEYQLANPHTVITKNIFASGSIFYKIRNTTGSGISDHLPVRADLTF